ncbi:FG-GAP-like repeat-containing protein [Streptomyces sp. R35]|uniref:FG-GAP-like repeat-containing protein n=1 Tax=Streptomyces sp. R35 TaxID=3238630 RepID=A0AB39SCN3_9ACTN
MGRNALGRGRLATAVAVVALAVTGGGALPLVAAGTAAAAASDLKPWQGGNEVTSTTDDTKTQDVAIAGDGTAVTIWNQGDLQNTTTRKLYAAVRKPGSGVTFGAPHELAATPTSVGEAKLLTTADGNVTALWTEAVDNTSTAPNRLVSAVYDADQGSWREPVEVVSAADQAGYLHEIDLAEGPDGSLTAVWTGRMGGSADDVEISAAVRAADGTWSAPSQVSTRSADAAEAVYAPSVAVDTAGVTTVAFSQYKAGASVRTYTRAPGGTEWTASADFADGDAAQLAAADDGSLKLVYNKGGTKLYYAEHPGGTTEWSTPELAGIAEGGAGTPEPLVEPDGDVTLVWTAWRSMYSPGTFTATRTDGTWSARAPLSGTTGSVSDLAADAAISPDGTVRAVWSESGKPYTATRVDDTWSTAEPLDTTTKGDVYAQVAAGAEDTATAVWSAFTDTDNNGTADRWKTYGGLTAWPALGLTSATIPTTAALKGTTSSSTAWAPTWKLNRPSVSWSLTLTNTAGKVVRTLTGTPADRTVTPAWNGRTTSGGYAPNGTLRWKLSATAEEGGTAVQLDSGTLTVTGGAAVARDFAGSDGTPDGNGDLLTMNSTGTLTYQLGKPATGTFLGKTSGSGWEPTVKAVPFGDLNGDRCNDVLVRMTDGSLRGYKPACGKPLTPSTSYTTLGTGWSAYNVLTSPGDVTGDGRADLIARNSSTGAVYLYKGTSSGTLSARVKLYSDWSGYKKIVGVGDLNGDGIGDLLAQDKSNNLYRYTGTGSGTFKARVKLFSNWGGSYNTVVGVGDLTGDGKADLVSRDSSGNVWRNKGTGTGSFGSRTQIATGWGSYKSLS